MPHAGRKKSASGYYHIVPKGLADQILFENDCERENYINLLGESKREYGFLLHAYCLMSNHVHLVIEDPKDHLSEAMKFVHERFAMSQSMRTGRRGGIFSKPFWSEPIETDEYLLCAVRYAHANPAVAGICSASAYTWSSVRQYLGKCDGIADTTAVLDMLGGVQGFIEFSQQSHASAAPFPGSKLTRHLSDEEYLRIAVAAVGDCVRSLKALNQGDRAMAVQMLAKRGFPVAVITRITGLSRTEVAHCL